MRQAAWRRAITIALVLSAGAAAARTASAAPSPEPPADLERTKFLEAQGRYDAGDFNGALSLFQEVVGIGGSPNARLYVARCLRELGRLPEAYEEMSQTLRDAAARAETEARYGKTRDAAAAELAVIAPLVARLTIAVADPPPGLSIRVGGKPIEAARLGKPMAVAPGEIEVVAEAPGREPFKRRLTLNGGSTETLAIALKAAASPDGGSGKETTTATAGGEVRIAGFVAAGLGVVGLATFAIAGSAASSKYDEVYAACGGTHCKDPSFSDEISTGRTLDLVANIGLVTGAVGVAGGVTMILVGGPRPQQAAMTVSPAGTGLVWRGRF